MGIFEYFSAEKRRERHVEKLVRSANNKYKPKEYRQPALSELIEMANGGDAEAISGLIARFAVNAEPSSEDEREKDWVCEALIDIGERALPQIRRALRSAESVSWMHRTLKQIVSPEAYKKELLDVLSDFDTEYEKNPDRKLQTIVALSETEGEEIAEALLRFLEDVDETVRFQTVGALAKLECDLARESLLKTMCEDESLRIRNEVIDAFSRLGWSTRGYKKKIDALLPKGYKHEKSGRIVKIGSGS